MTIPIVILPLVLVAAALAIEVVLFLALRPRGAPRRRALNPWFTIVVCAAGLGVCAALFVTSDRDERTYLSDSACLARFGAAYGDQGRACRLASARIVNAYRTYGRHSSARHIECVLPDGSRHDVDIAASASDPVFLGARSGTDRTAIVQLFHDRIVEIETNSGTVEANSFPARRRQKYALFGILLGFLGVAYCLRAAFPRA